MSEETAKLVVGVSTTVRLNDPGVNTIDIVIDAEDEQLELKQDSDRIVMSREASVALARVILQRHRVSFEPEYFSEPYYA